MAAVGDPIVRLQAPVQSGHLPGKINEKNPPCESSGSAFIQYPSGGIIIYYVDFTLSSISLSLDLTPAALSPLLMIHGISSNLFGEKNGVPK